MRGLAVLPARAGPEKIASEEKIANAEKKDSDCGGGSVCRVG